MGEAKRTRQLLAMRLLVEVEKTFAECQGLRLYSTEESDRYWEMSERLMKAYANATGKKLRRKKPE